MLATAVSRHELPCSVLPQIEIGRFTSHSSLTLATFPSMADRRQLRMITDQLIGDCICNRIGSSLSDSCAFVVTTNLASRRVRIQGGQISGITSRLFRR